MRRYIVDASVAVKWFVPEVGHERAAGLLNGVREGNLELSAPDLMVLEFGSAMASKVGAGLLSVNEATERLFGLTVMPVTLSSAVPLAPMALEIAAQSGITFYDSVYVAAARRTRASLITADMELVRCARRKGLGDLVIPLSAASA